MNPKGLAERAELVKWWDALDLVIGAWTQPKIDEGLHMARESQHPEAQWLASLFPAGVAVTMEQLWDVMRQQGEDPRALFVLWKTMSDRSLAVLRRTAERGYAPAQAELAFLELQCQSDAEAYVLAQQSALQGDRCGLFVLGYCLYEGQACAKDKARSFELYKESAELGHPEAAFYFGHLAYGEDDWELYYWWGLAAKRRVRSGSFCVEMLGFLPSFEKGEFSRVLHTAAPVLRGSFDTLALRVLGSTFSEGEFRNLQRVVELHDAMLDRARQAIHAWSGAGLRHGMVKDVRVMIAKMAWADAWRWGGTK
jgi:hypothetical protein